MSIQIQRLEKLNREIYEQIIKLLQQLSESVNINNFDYFESMVLNTGVHFFCAFDEVKLVGIATIVIYNIPTGYRAVIEDVVVDRSYRGKGIGKSLMRFIIAFSKTQRIPYLNLTSNPKREAANRLYQSLGFELRVTNAYVLKI